YAEIMRTRQPVGKGARLSCARDLEVLPSRPRHHAQAVDPSGPKPNRRNRSASSSRPCWISTPGSSRAAYQSPVDPGAQYMFGPVQAATPGQQPGQVPGGVPVVGVSPSAQPVQVAAVGHQQPVQLPGQLIGGVPPADYGQQPGQLPGGGLVAGVGPGAQHLFGLVQVAGPGQLPGQLPSTD